MIIIDISNLCYSNMMVHLNDVEEMNESMFRHMVLTSIRKNLTKFKPKYGDNIVIACDTGKPWRSAFFRYYKAGRAKTREDSKFDWMEIHKYFENFKKELKEYFSYKVIEVDGAEADDVIGHLVQKNGVQIGDGDGRILILSADKDFIQLQKYSNVDQYDPIRDKPVTHKNPEDYLVEHIIRGDRGDGIPNAMSPDDTFVNKNRSYVLTAKRFSSILETVNDGTINSKEYNRNQTLIDLSYTPKHLREKIDDEYSNESNKGKRDLIPYFMKFRLANLLSTMGDF